MTLQLRQICLVARELEPVIRDLTEILGINQCYVDDGVGKFGLENTLMPIGRNFLEVVAPIEEDTAAGRYLDRRNGDGGYMFITQADSVETQQQVRQNAADNGVRVAWESTREDWNLIQLHPGDLQTGFFEVETDAINDFNGNWHPVGGVGWESQVKQDVTVDYLAVEMQGNDPVALAELWSNVSGLAVERDGSDLNIAFNNVILRFVEASDGRGNGLGGIDIAVADRDHVLREATARDCYVSDDQVDICGVRWYLKNA
jgi:hypothetical protein